MAQLPSPALCGGLDNGANGPFDFRNERQLLMLGEKNHFTPKVEALIRGDWKLMQNNPFSPLELYNLKDDPHENNNLIAEQTKVANELGAALRLHIQRGGVVPWQPPVSPTSTHPQ